MCRISGGVSMNLAVFATIIALMLAACSSNHQTAVSQQQIDSKQTVKKTIESYPKQQRSPVIPIDGRLRDEHIQMYVSVKIKQEQLRYQQEESNSTIQIKNTVSNINSKENQPVNSDNSFNITPASLIERVAVEEFDFNVQLYHWVKQTIRYTQARRTEMETSNQQRISSFEEYVMAHNLEMLERHADELHFAANYKITLPSSMKQHRVNIGSTVANQQTTNVLKPSS